MQKNHLVFAKARLQLLFKGRESPWETHQLSSTLHYRHDTSRLFPGDAVRQGSQAQRVLADQFKKKEEGATAVGGEELSLQRAPGQGGEQGGGEASAIVPGLQDDVRAAFDSNGAPVERAQEDGGKEALAKAVGRQGDVRAPSHSPAEPPEPGKWFRVRVYTRHLWFSV